MRSEWWPATPLEPQTSATFTLLQLLHLLSLQAKTSGYDLWRVLECMTENFGLRKLPVRLTFLLLII